MALCLVPRDVIDFIEVSKSLRFVKCMSFQTSGYSTYVIREAVGNSFFRHFITILTFQTLQIDSNIFFDPTNRNLRGLLQIKVVFHMETEF